MTDILRDGPGIGETGSGSQKAADMAVFISTVAKILFDVPISQPAEAPQATPTQLPPQQPIVHGAAAQFEPLFGVDDKSGGQDNGNPNVQEVQRTALDDEYLFGRDVRGVAEPIVPNAQTPPAEPHGGLSLYLSEMPVKIVNETPAVHSVKPDKKPKRVGLLRKAIAGIASVGVLFAGGVIWNSMQREAPAPSSTAPETPETKTVPDINLYNAISLDVMSGKGEYLKPVTAQLDIVGTLQIPYKYFKLVNDGPKVFNKALDGGMWVQPKKKKNFWGTLSADAANKPLDVALSTAVELEFAFIGKDKAPFTFKKTDAGYTMTIDPSLWKMVGSYDYKDGNMDKGFTEKLVIPKLQANPLQDKTNVANSEIDRIGRLLVAGPNYNAADDPLVATSLIQSLVGGLIAVENGKAQGDKEAAIDAAAKGAMTYFITEAGKKLGVDITVVFAKDKETKKEKRFTVDLPADFKAANKTLLDATLAKYAVVLPKTTLMKVKPTYTSTGIDPVIAESLGVK